jgi:hypothetical protein
MKKAIFSAAGLLVLMLLGTGTASADIYNLTIGIPNAALSGYTGPYATVTINRTATNSATVTFDSLTNGGYIYFLGDGGTADLNVNGTYTLGAVTESNSISGFTPSFKNNAPGNLASFGVFNLSLNNNGGFTDSATEISFTLTATGTTSWSTAASVLTPNDSGYLAGVHAFACAQPGCSTSSGAALTGFAVNGGGAVPEPASIMFFGTGLLVAGLVLRRKVSS